MEHFSNLILRIAIIMAFIAYIVLLGVFISFIRTEEKNWILYCLFSIYCVILIPFTIALMHAFKLLYFIDKNIAFSQRSIDSINVIKRCAIVIFLICVFAGLPFVYQFAQLLDAPGIMLMGVILSGIAFVIALFAAVMHKVLENVIVMKTENDLTI